MADVIVALLTGLTLVATVHVVLLMEKHASQKRKEMECARCGRCDKEGKKNVCG